MTRYYHIDGPVGQFILADLRRQRFKEAQRSFDAMFGHRPYTGIDLAYGSDKSAVAFVLPEPDKRASETIHRQADLIRQKDATITCLRSERDALQRRVEYLEERNRWLARDQRFARSDLTVTTAEHQKLARAYAEAAIEIVRQCDTIQVLAGTIAGTVNAERADQKKLRDVSEKFASLRLGIKTIADSINEQVKKTLTPWFGCVLDDILGRLLRVLDATKVEEQQPAGTVKPDNSRHGA